MRTASGQMTLLPSDRSKFPHERTHADRLRDCLNRVRQLAEDNSVDPAESMRSLNEVREAIETRLSDLREYEP